MSSASARVACSWYREVSDVPSYNFLLSGLLLDWLRFPSTLAWAASRVRADWRRMQMVSRCARPRMCDERSLYAHTWSAGLAPDRRAVASDGAFVTRQRVQMVATHACNCQPPARLGFGRTTACMDDAVVVWRQPRQGRLQPCTTATGSSLRSAAMRYSSSLARPWHTGTHTHPAVGDRCSLFQPPVTHNNGIDALPTAHLQAASILSGLLGCSHSGSLFGLSHSV